MEGVHLKMDDLSEGQMTGGAVAQQQPAAAIRLTPAPPIKQVLQMPPQLEQRLLGLEQQVRISERWLVDVCDCLTPYCRDTCRLETTVEDF